MGLSTSRAEGELLRLVDWAAVNGGGFAVLWHTERFDSSTSRGWDRLYLRLIQAVRDSGGVCVSVGDLAREADAWLA
jgi:peptidoglycan/xylan/chitin deacetylase (PgdA/CDA1 family)